MSVCKRIQIFKNIPTLLLMILAIINSGCPLGTIYYNYISITLFAISVSVFLFKCRSVSIRQLQYVMALNTLVLLSMGINLDFDLSHYTGVILNYLSVLFLVSVIDFREFCKWYVNVLFVICLYSLVLTIIYTLSKSIVQALPVFSFESSGRWAHFHYIYYIWGGYSSIWTTIIRNSGFFREPGVFSAHICMALIIISSVNLKIIKSMRTRIIYVVIMVLTGLTTMSSVGVIGSLMCMLFYIRKEKLRYFKPILFFSLAVVAVYFVWDNHLILLSKLSINSYQYASFGERINGIVSAFDVWQENLLLGRGYNYFQSRKNGVSTFFFFDMGAKHGILFALIFCYGIYCFLRNVSDSKSAFILNFMIYSMFLITQGLVDVPVFMALQMYCLRPFPAHEYKNKALGGTS